MANALQIVQKLFPEVTSVKDATKDLEIEVTKRDTSSATVRNHKACAMAVACKRKLEADGVIMSVSTAYVIKDKKATRYKVPEAVSREVVSFDRNSGFEEGKYKLKAQPPASRLGHHRGGKNTSSDESTRGNMAKRFFHKTGGIRTSLGSSGAV